MDASSSPLLEMTTGSESPFGEPEEDALAFMSQFLESSRSLELAAQFFNARDSTVALRRYVPVLLDALEQFDAEPAEAVAARSLVAQVLDEETKQRIRQEVDDYLSRMEAEIVEMPVDEAILGDLSSEEAYADPFAAMAQILNVGDLTRSYASLVQGVARLPHDEAMYWNEYLRARHRSSVRPLLLRSQYLVATSLIQPSVASLLLLVLRSEGDNLAEPPSRTSLDGQVTKLLRQGPREWRRRLIQRFGIDALDTAIDWVELEQVWARRNLFSHRGGLVDSGYRDAVSEALPVGAPVELTVDDVYTAFDFAGGARIGFLAATADLIVPGTAKRFASAHGEIAMEDLANGRWWLAEGVSRAAFAYADTAEGKALAQVNIWLAREGRLGREAIRTEVRDWDTSGLSPLFELAREVLLGNDRAALDLIETLVASHHLTPSELEIWPLFARLRSQGLLSLDPQIGSWVEG